MKAFCLFFRYTLSSIVYSMRARLKLPVLVTIVIASFNAVPVSAETYEWWRQFDDPMLDSVVVLAEQRNYDLAIAARRVEIARQAVRTAQAGYYPQITLGAGWGRERRSGASTGPDIPATTASQWQGDLSVSWEVDLFGKITSMSRRSKEMLKVSRAEFDAALISLQAEAANLYIKLRMAQEQLDVAQTHSISQKNVVNLTEARYKAGLASQLDVNQAKTVYFSTIASIPLLENSIKSYLNSIAILTGEYPSKSLAMLQTDGRLPDYHGIIASQVPAELIGRRPDVIAARLQIEADAQALGISKKDYLPSLVINGSIGAAAHNAGDLFTKNSFTYSVAPTLSWTIFDGFARRAKVATARQQLESDVDSYNLTMITAVEEVDNAMMTYTSYVKYVKMLEDVIEQSEESLKRSLELYKSGLSPFSNVVDAQLNVLNYRNSLVTARGNAILSLITLYKALGGSWMDNSLKD